MFDHLKTNGSPNPQEWFCTGYGPKRVAFKMDSYSPEIKEDVIGAKKIQQRMKIKSSQEMQMQDTSRLAMNRIQRNVLSSANSSCEKS